MGLPLIDLGKGEGTDARIAQRIDAALCSAGFFGIVGHGVPVPVVDAAFDAGHRFFALPQKDKARWHINGWPLKRGFDPIGWQALDPGQIGCGANTDWGALTLLAQDDAGGLQVQRADGEWLDVPPVPGAFVVNVGDMMQRWTNDRWPSTMHRVINRFSGRDRWSIAYFFDLDAESRIEPLPSCVTATRPPRYAPITAGEHLIEMYRKTTVAA